MKSVLPEVQYATNYAWNELSTFKANNKIIKKEGNHAGRIFLKCSPILSAGQCNNRTSIPS